MKLSPGQIREVLGLSQDTFRHWKKALPPLAGRNGYRPCFSPGDLLALALIRALTEDAGVQVSALHAVATGLFDYCGQHSWAELERSTLVIELAGGRFRFLTDTNIPQLDKIGIVVSCRPIVADLRERLLMEKEDNNQGNLRFPPTVVSADGRRGRAS
jgi:DNA-binding transcriptional MerR regulator